MEERKSMTKNCSRYPPASRADMDSSISRRFRCRKNEFRPENALTEKVGIDETGDGVFLMNRFYGEKIIRPMMKCVAKEFAGDIGLTVANRLEKAMYEKNGFIRGDELLELLKDGLGLECAVSLIGQMKRFKKMGMYGDRIVTNLSILSDPDTLPLKAAVRTRSCKLSDADCTDSEEGACPEYRQNKGGKEKANWKTNAKTK